MTIEKVISYSDAVLSSSNELEKLENDIKIALKPRNAVDGSNALVILYCDFSDENSFEPHVIPWLSDKAYDQRFIGEAFKFKTAAEGGPEGDFTGTDKPFASVPYNSRYNNLRDFSIELDYTPGQVADWGMIINEFFFYSSSLRGRWYLRRNGTELEFFTFDDNYNVHTLATSGLGLTVDTKYKIRVSYHGVGNDTSEVKISVDGSQVASTSQAKLLKIFNDTECPLVTLGASYAYNAAVPMHNNNDRCRLADFAMYDSVLASSYTPRTGLLKIFSQSDPTARLTLDSGFEQAAWDLSSIFFSDETDFNNNGIKLRLDADEDDSPDFSGDTNTLSQFRTGTDPIGRYLHLEFTFYSDGDTKRTLHSGKIEILTGKPSAIARRKPEIVRR